MKSYQLLPQGEEVIRPVIVLVSVSEVSLRVKNNSVPTDKQASWLASRPMAMISSEVARYGGR